MTNLNVPTEQHNASYRLGSVMNVLDGWFPEADAVTIYAAASDIVSDLFPAQDKEAANDA